MSHSSIDIEGLFIIAASLFCDGVPYTRVLRSTLIRDTTYSCFPSLKSVL